MDFKNWLMSVDKRNKQENTADDYVGRINRMFQNKESDKSVNDLELFRSQVNNKATKTGDDSNNASALKAYIRFRQSIDNNGQRSTALRGEIPDVKNDYRKKDTIAKPLRAKEKLPIEFQVLKKNNLNPEGTYAKVYEVAKELRTFISKTDIQEEIRKRHKVHATSVEIQEIIRKKLTEMGFQSEKKGLFKEYSTSGLTPDYYLPIDDTGIILEVERGGTTTNNRDLLDIWKCHICKHARYLFLIVPQERPTSKGKRTKQFMPVSNRLKTFFEPNNYVNVDAVFLFGY